MGPHADKQGRCARCGDGWPCAAAMAAGVRVIQNPTTSVIQPGLSVFIPAGELPPEMKGDDADV